MTEQKAKSAEKVVITWEDGEEETFVCGDKGEVFVVHSGDEDHYMSIWSGGMALFQAVMASVIEFRARLEVVRIRHEDKEMVDRFIEDVLGKGE